MYNLIFSTGRAIVVDIGFCVKNGVVSLTVNGVYVGAIIKKRQYWPKSVPGGIGGCRHVECHRIK